ncbi:topoisomerase C-terminal repeat-containing protein, partial [Bacillus canaveralius]|uniref:topoisomerase C-terminal repeat-containing protein n=1 Tax=Bacillus canaveralius TaxID=1403243 RepID=UPI000FB274EB
PRSPKQKRVTKLGKCRKCDGQVIDKGSFFGCTNYKKTGCKFTLSKKIAGKTITQKLAKTLLEQGTTDTIEGFKGKDKLFNAKLTWDANNEKIVFLFEKSPSGV